MAKAKAERNLKIVAMYDDTTRRNSFNAIARQFDLAPQTVQEIYKRTKAKLNLQVNSGINDRQEGGQA